MYEPVLNYQVISLLAVIAATLVYALACYIEYRRRRRRLKAMLGGKV